MIRSGSGHGYERASVSGNVCGKFGYLAWKGVGEDLVVERAGWSTVVVVVAAAVGVAVVGAVAAVGGGGDGGDGSWISWASLPPLERCR